MRQDFRTRTQCDLRDAAPTVRGHGGAGSANGEDGGHLRALRPPPGPQAVV